MHEKVAVSASLLAHWIWNLGKSQELLLISGLRNIDSIR